MAYGSVTGSTTTFIAGTLVSLMDDVHDTLCMVLATNLHVQRIGSALLLAGGFSHATITVSRTRDRGNPVQASHDACIWLVGTACFLFCRFVVFPAEVLAIYRE